MPLLKLAIACWIVSLAIGGAAAVICRTCRRLALAVLAGVISRPSALPAAASAATVLAAAA